MCAFQKSMGIVFDGNICQTKGEINANKFATIENEFHLECRTRQSISNLAVRHSYFKIYRFLQSILT